MRCVLPVLISIHALLAESDPPRQRHGGQPGHFYPRSPCGERHSRQYICPQNRKISIHALLAESDIRTTILEEVTLYFYPRSPCGERRGSVAGNWRPAIFLSTLSLRRATITLIVLSTQPIRFLSTLSLRRATMGRYFL